VISFKNHRTFITGAGSGIGLATARLFLQLGAEVFASDINSAALNALKTESGENPRLSLSDGDVSSPSDCRRLVEEAVAGFGQIDSLIHSAGIYSAEKKVHQLSDDEWLKTIDINANGTFYICRAVIPHLSNNSAIVNVASIAAHQGSPLHPQYAAAKGAVLSLSKSLAVDLAPKTRVNVVSPGVIETPMTESFRNEERGKNMLRRTPLGRFGRAEEIAGPIAFLCSPLASYVTGEAIQINGGFYIS